MGIASTRVSATLAPLLALTIGLGPVGAAALRAQELRPADGRVAAVPLDRLPADTLPAELPTEFPLGLERFLEAPAASPAIVALGRRLFFDPVLSGDHTLACATCHQPNHGFAEPLAKSIGIGGQDVGRNAPSVLNLALAEAVLWDGRATSLEHQVQLVIEAEKELGLPLPEAVARLTADERYRAEFEAAFGAPPNVQNLATALASFLRRLTFGGSPVDQFRAGDITALDSNEENGMWLFEGRGRCWKCHVGPSFSDQGFHNTGVGALPNAAATAGSAEVADTTGAAATPEPGRAAVTGLDEDQGKFRTPGLRGVALTPPYMHDGSLATLEEVIEFYRRGAGPNSHVSPHLAPIVMSDTEAANLVEFLKALSR